METIASTRSAATGTAWTAGVGEARLDNPAYQAFWLLRLGLTVAPILFGLDKLTNLLAALTLARLATAFTPARPAARA